MSRRYYHFIATDDCADGAPRFASSRKYELAEWLKNLCLTNPDEARLITVWRMTDGYANSGQILTDKDIFGD